MWKVRLLREKIGEGFSLTILSILFFIFSIFGYFLIGSNSIFIISFHISLLLFGYSFLYSGNHRSTIKSLIGKCNLATLKVILLYSIFGFLLLIFILFSLYIIWIYLNFPISNGVVDKISAFSPLLILTAIFLAPLSEEIFFRAFLVKRVGIIFSSLLFALSHFAYNSDFELVGAFFIGLVLAYTFKKSKSIIPSILIHFIYNLIIMLIFWWFY